MKGDKTMTKKNLINTSIAFGGFYESIHDSRIDNMIESYNDSGNYPEYVWDNVNYKKTHQSYIESWTSDFESYLLNEYQVDINFKDLTLWSPKYYNYKTDCIDCKVNTHQMNLLNEKLLSDSDFINWLKERTKSYDGYMSFYNFDEAKNNKDNILIKYVLEFLADKFNEQMDFVEFEIHLLKEKAA